MKTNNKKYERYIYIYLYLCMIIVPCNNYWWFLTHSSSLYLPLVNHLRLKHFTCMLASCCFSLHYRIYNLYSLYVGMTQYSSTEKISVLKLDDFAWFCLLSLYIISCVHSMCDGYNAVLLLMLFYSISESTYILYVYSILHNTFNQQALSSSINIIPMDVK